VLPASPGIAGRAARVGLFLAAGLGLILSVLDPWPAAQLPWHDHLVVGAHGLREWARALVSHRHEPPVWPARALIDIQAARAKPAVGASATPRVLSVNPRSDGAGPAIFDLSSVLVADAGARMRLMIPHRSEAVRGRDIRMLAPVSVSVPLHPPRTSP
jgi:hypothetical protein